MSAEGSAWTREPVAYVTLIEAILTLVVTFGLDLTSGQIGLIMAVATAILGIYTAWATADTMLGAVVGLIKAVAALAIGFGAHVAPEQTGTFIVLVTAVFGLYHRTQTSPVPLSSPA